MRVTALVAGLGALAVIPATAGATGWKGWHGSNAKVVGGGTTVAVDPAAAGALQSLGVALRPIGAAEAGPSGVTFPITYGVVNKTTLAGQIRHIGGLELSKGATTVKLKRFFVNIDASPDLTGRVSVNGSRIGRAELFSLDLSKLVVERKGHYLKLSGVGLKLTQGAADALNGAFQTTAFAGGLLFGTATVETHIVSRHWDDDEDEREDSDDRHDRKGWDD
jgi:hypothetical protein